MLLVYTAIADAAREGVRYAIVHGSSRGTGSGQNNASGPSSNPAQVITIIDNFAGTGPLNHRQTAVIRLSLYPGSCERARTESANVSVVYLHYDPLVTLLPRHTPARKRVAGAGHSLLRTSVMRFGSQKRSGNHPRGGSRQPHSNWRPRLRNRRRPGLRPAANGPGGSRRGGRGRH